MLKKKLFMLLYVTASKKSTVPTVPETDTSFGMPYPASLTLEMGHFCNPPFRQKADERA